MAVRWHGVSVERVRKLGRWVPALAWMALLTYWSGQSFLPIDHGPVAEILRGAQHRLAHIVAYAVLGALLRWAWGRNSGALVWSVLIASAFGASDEWHQTMTAGRRPAIDDWLTDTAAAVLGAGILDLYSRGKFLVRWTPPPLLPRAVVAGLFAVGIWLAIAPHAPAPVRVGQQVAARVTTLLPQPMERYALRVAQHTVSVARAARAELRQRVTG